MTTPDGHGRREARPQCDARDGCLGVGDRLNTVEEALWDKRDGVEHRLTRVEERLGTLQRVAWIITCGAMAAILGNLYEVAKNLTSLPHK